MKMERNLGIGLVLVAGLLSSNALAQTVAPAGTAQFGQAGQFALSAERLFGLTWSQSKESDTVAGVDVEDKTSYTTLSLLSNASGGQTTGYSFARVGGDYFVIDGLSVGAALGFVSLSGVSTETEGEDSESRDTADVTGFLLAPRAGYAFMFSDTVGIWPRGGITYLRVSADDDDANYSYTMSRLALTVEAPLVIAPVPHAGFLIAPTLDLGVTGSNTTDDGNDETDIDATSTDVGLQAGVFLYF